MDRREAIQKIEAIIDNGQDYGYWTDAQRKALNLAIEALKQTEIVRCKDCKHYNPPHIEYNDGTRKDYPDGLVTVDIGMNVGGKCENSTITMRTYCTAHDRENPHDYEEIVIFREPMEYCSFSEKAEKYQLSGETSTNSGETSTNCGAKMGGDTE